MKLKYQQREATQVIEVQAKRIDAACALEFKNKILDHMGNQNSDLILDLRHVNYIDSSGLGAIVGIFKKLSREAAFYIVGLTSAVQRMFELTRMDRVFKIHPCIDDLI